MHNTERRFAQQLCIPRYSSRIALMVIMLTEMVLYCTWSIAVHSYRRVLELHDFCVHNNSSYV